VKSAYPISFAAAIQVELVGRDCRPSRDTAIARRVPEASILRRQIYNRDSVELALWKELQFAPATQCNRFARSHP
jgi:hypothetical protein